MRKILVVILIVIAVIVYGVVNKISKKNTANGLTQKLYVAVEGAGKIAVVDPKSRKTIKTINLSVEHEGGLLPYAPHNVQVSPDMKTVWVTANAESHQEHASSLTTTAYAHTDEPAGDDWDELIVINPLTDKIIYRIPIGKNLHLAHVVITNDSKDAYVTAQLTGEVYKINALSFEIEETISLPENSEPHGLRIAPNGDLYIAAKNQMILLQYDSISKPVSFALDGTGVQTGVTPNGMYVMVSVYDKKSLAILEAKSTSVGHMDYSISLPPNAMGPIQMYPTPDSKFVYLADQGYYFSQPEGEIVYKIDLEEKKIVKEIKAGRGPHGVMVSPDGKFVYVTNLLSGDVSVIDTSTDTEIAKIPVGPEPNGISFWERPILPR